MAARGGRSRRAALVRAGYACERCGSTVQLQVDHRRPLRDGGTNELPVTAAIHLSTLDLLLALLIVVLVLPLALLGRSFSHR